jgi:two-component system nitrogen regulation response regulator NtrX
VGGHKTISVNVRVLAATNKNLEEEIENGNFRADLFWRLNVVPIRVPDLAERLEDIPLLVESLLTALNNKGMAKKEFTKDALALMARHSWPGNVRELKNFVERVAIMCASDQIDKNDVMLFLNPYSRKLPSNIPATDEMLAYREASFKDAKKQFEQEYLRFKLNENEGNVSQTAESVGMERSHLHKKLKSLNITT